MSFRRPVAGGPARSAGLLAGRLTACLVLLVASAGGAAAQIADTTQVPVDSVVVMPQARPTVVPGEPADVRDPMTPRGAFIRSMAVPGWGQSAFGSYFRGGVYFSGWAANWFMIFRNQVRLDEARTRFDHRVDQIEAELIAASPNPDSMRAVLDTVPSVLDEAIRADTGPGNTANNLRNLVSAREQQREDWIAWSIFWVLASGIDGYVTAHLSDFPVGIDVRRNPDRSISVGLEVPLPARWP